MNGQSSLLAQSHAEEDCSTGKRYAQHQDPFSVGQFAIITAKNTKFKNAANHLVQVITSNVSLDNSKISVRQIL